VAKITGERTARPGQLATVTLDCRGLEEKVLNNRISTTRANFVTYHTSGKTEAEIISQWLQDAGIAGGDISVDSGQFIVPWTWLDDESPIEDAWMLAASAGGRFYASADGVFVYENLQHWLMSPHDTSQETINRDDFSDFRPYYNDRELYEGVTVEVAVREIGVPSVVYEPDEPISVPAGTNITVTARFRQPIYTAPTVAFQAVSSGGKDITADVSIATTVYAQRALMTITNNNATYAANLKNLTITSNPVQGARTVDESATSSDSFWTARDGRTRTLRNVYIQTRAQGAMLAEFLRDRYESPRLFFNVINGPGKPGRRLGDHVTLSDSVLMSASRDAYITSISWRWSVTGFYQDLELVDQTGLFPHAGNYFVIGTDTLDATTSARVFY
jgi:hypothetical protein